MPRFERRLVEAGVITEEDLDALRRAIKVRVDAATDAVENEPLPEAHTLYGNVYAGSDAAWL